MKRFIVMTTFALALIFTASIAFAEAPELRGTWKGTVAAVSTNGFGEGEIAFVIKEQKGQLFSGVKLWFNKNNVLRNEAFRGIFDNGRLYLAEFNDGYGFGYLTGKQNMTINYLEDGSSNKALIHKLERLRFTTGFVEIDKDGNNVIMRAEITNHYPLNAERILKEADKNKDGKLTKKEWDAWKKANNWQD